MTPPRVLTLTLQHPWAWAILLGGKDIENRLFQPGEPFLMLVHQGHKDDPDGEAFLRSIGVKPPRWPMRRGCIVGAVRVVSWQDDSPSPWAMPGRWHWNLAGPVVAARPLAHRGRPGLFLPPDGWGKAFDTTKRRRRT